MDELRSAKEKLYSCEALVARLGKRDRNEDGSASDVLDHQLNSLTQQVISRWTWISQSLGRWQSTEVAFALLSQRTRVQFSASAKQILKNYS